MKPQIAFSDFAKLDIRVGEIKEASEVPDSKHLLKLTVNFGDELGIKTIFAGIKEWYNTASLKGRKLSFIVNLEPKKFLIGDKVFESQGMLVAADPGGKAVLYNFDEDLPVGAILR